MKSFIRKYKQYQQDKAIRKCLYLLVKDFVFEQSVVNFILDSNGNLFSSPDGVNWSLFQKSVRWVHNDSWSHYAGNNNGKHIEQMITISDNPYSLINALLLMRRALGKVITEELGEVLFTSINSTPYDEQRNRLNTILKSVASKDTRMDLIDAVVSVVFLIDD